MKFLILIYSRKTNIMLTEFVHTSTSFEVWWIYLFLLEAFLELDEDQSLQMEFPDFVNAWKWLELKGDETTLASVFSKIDQDKDGVINETEFIMAVMQEETNFEHLTHPAQVQKTTLAIDRNEITSRN